MPPISGCTTRSKASRPKRRFTNDARLSSSLAAPRGVKYSAAIRSFPPREKSGVVANGKKRRRREWKKAGRRHQEESLRQRHGATVSNDEDALPRRGRGNQALF